MGKTPFFASILLTFNATALAAQPSVPDDSWKRLEGHYTLVADESDGKCLPAATDSTLGRASALELRISLETSLAGSITQSLTTRDGDQSTTYNKQVPVQFIEINRGPQFFLIRDDGAPIRSVGWSLARWDGQVLEATETGIGGRGFPVKLHASRFRIERIDDNSFVYRGDGPAGRIRGKGCLFRR